MVKFKRLLGTALGVSLFGLASTAQAVPVSYSFVGTISGSGDLGSGGVVFIDAALTVTGMTLSDIDTIPLEGAATYSAMSTYSIAGFGDFITDGSTGEFYSQFDIGGLILQVGLLDTGASGGFAPTVNAGIGPGDADDGVLPLGGPFVSDSTGFAARSMTNLAGHTLSMSAVEISEFSVFAKVPEPGTLAITVLGLAGLGFGPRRKAA